MDKTFDHHYNRLNPQQKEAVDTIDGPVLMIAGPGSGKTQVLAVRIANIIKQTDTPPESILALTFTEKATANMRNRLVQLIGTDAYKIVISTFHGFSNELINRYPEKFLFAKDLIQLDDLTRVKILQEILDKNEFEHLKIFTSPYFYLHNIRANIGTLKREGVTSESFIEIVSKHQEYFDRNKEINSKTGKLKRKWEGYQKQIDKNSELARAYTEYAITLRDNGYYDFEDMIMFVNKQLNYDPDFLADIRETYLYTLADEYQDTNGAQNQLLMSLNSFDDRPNLFVVGDEDQAIFSFQGANIRNILEFKEQFPTAAIITTKFNYRSRQGILDAATDLISNNPERLEKYFPNVDKQLVSALTSEEMLLLDRSQKPIIRIETESGKDEANRVVKKIEDIIKKGTEPKEIAIIYRNHSDASDYATELSAANVQYTTDTGNNVFLSPVVKKLITVFEYLRNNTDSEKLIRILHLNTWDIDQTDLYRLLKQYGEENDEELLDIIINPNQLLAAGIGSSEAILKVANIILCLKQASFNMPLDQLFVLTLEETGLINELLTANTIADINSVNAFHDFIKHRQLVNEQYGLSNLLTDITNLKQNSLKLSAETAAMYTGGVHLLTSHKAKGLEFEHVFIVKAIDGNWGNKRVPNKLKLLDLHEPGITESKQEKESKNNEERRLFFVALTRAKKQVYISHAQNYLNLEEYKVKKATPTMFLAEISNDRFDESSEVAKLTDEERIKELLQGLVKEKSSSSSELTDTSKSYLQAIIQKRLKLSASSLNTYLECPHRFLYQYILRVPKYQEKHMILGLAVHKALEYWGRERMNDNPSDKISLENLLSQANELINRHALGEKDSLELTSEANKVISEYYPHLTSKKTTFAAVEYGFANNVHLKDIPLKGRIDAIELTKSENELGLKPKVTLVDYKSGRPKSRNKLLGKNSYNTSDQNYYRQLTFYSLLSQLDRTFPYQVDNIAVEFIKMNASGKFKREEFNISEDDIAELKEIIENVWLNIMELKFETRCNKENCIVCELG